MDQEFEQALKDVETLTAKPTNEELLLLYGLYKQVTVGNNTGNKPFAIDITRRAKWEAWNQQINRSKEECQRDYVNLVNSLIAMYRRP